MAISPSNKSNNANKTFLFEKENYYLMFIGLAVILIGFMLMAGGRSTDLNQYSTEAFSFRRITLAPFVVMLGFVIEMYAIMKKPKKTSE